MTASMIRVDGEVIDASGAIGGIGAGEAVCDDRTRHAGMIAILDVVLRHALVAVSGVHAEFAVGDHHAAGQAGSDVVQSIARVTLYAGGNDRAVFTVRQVGEAIHAVGVDGIEVVSWSVALQTDG